MQILQGRSEERVALCRTKCLVVQLEDDSETESKKSIRQRGTVGHMIVYPQRPRAIAEMLPPTVKEITSPVCVIFVGPLWVSGKRVRRALSWLRENNPLYKNIQFNEEVLEQLDRDPVLPIHIQHVIPSKATMESTSRYDNIDLDEFIVGEDDNKSNTAANVVISDVDGDASYADLKLAVWNHVKKNGQGYIRIPHDPDPCNEFNNPALLPIMYPTLFPYGVGGLEDRECSRLVSFERGAKHLVVFFESRDAQRNSRLDV
ncbi:hypothetical protein ARMGADRAFT_1121965 [Armillaria gallica]|uniref:DUF6570 domain-containing protein n=1 Tax=Armillaria gallica TaxID=47427 RepID=A0A2H3D7L1_ARMGA|nr:hypothetical protein ARMGADRAFT_1121965 [Armillaria gallica]